MRTAETFGFDLFRSDGDPQDLEDPSDSEDWDPGDTEDDDALDHPAFECLDDVPDECPDCSSRGVECPYGADSEYR